MLAWILRLLRGLGPGRRDPVHAALARYGKQPGPRETIRLIQAYVEARDLTKALQVAKAGFQRFPRSARIRSYYLSIRKQKSSSEIHALRRAIASEPRPDLYARLGEIYRYLGDNEMALETAHEGVKQFPNADGNYLTIGRIHYALFTKSRSGRDGLRASKYLERALEISRNNYKTLFFLANLYGIVGAKGRALPLLDRILGFAPDDSRARELREMVSGLPEEPLDDLADYFQRYEGRQKGWEEVKTSAYARILEDPGALASKLGELGRIPGVEGVIVLDPSGNVLAAAPEDGRHLGPSLHSMIESARRSTKRMSIGVFERGLVLGTGWHAYLHDMDSYGLFIFGGKDARPELVERKVASVIHEGLPNLELAGR